MQEKGYRAKRIKSVVLHNEGNLTLSKLIRKRFLYGKDTLKYINKRKTQAFWQYFPVRKSYIKNWKLFAKQPVIGIGTIFMRIVEYIAGFLGILYSFFIKLNTKNINFFIKNMFWNKDKTDKLYDDVKNLLVRDKITYIDKCIVSYYKDKDRGMIRIADLGSGIGNTALPLLRFGYTIDAVEINRKSIEIFKSRVQKENSQDRVNFINSSIEDFPTVKKYDVILLIEVLEHTDNPEYILRKINNVLKINGLMIITTPNGYWLLELLITRPAIWLRKMLNITKYKGYHHLHFFTYKRLQKIINTAGFEIEGFQKTSFFPYFPILNKISILQKLDLILSRKAPHYLVNGWYFKCIKKKYFKNK